MTLSLYITRRFLRMVAQVLAIFFGIMLLIDVVDQLRRFSGQGIALSDALRLAALNVPTTLYRILPLIVVFGSVALFLGLARTSELVVVRAAGRSGLRFLVAPATAALMLGAAAVGVLNPLVAGLSREYDAVFSRLMRGSESVLSISTSGLWLREGGPAGQTVIQAARADGDGTRLWDATFLRFGPDGAPIERIAAAEAVLEPGAWVLTRVKFWDLAAENPERGARRAETARLPSELTVERIRDGFGDPAAIPFWDLPAYIATLERAGFSARGHRVWLQMELAQPLLLCAMVLLAAGFTMRHARLGRTAPMVLLAVAAGFAIYFLRNFAQVLGESGQIPVALAAWSPPVAAALSALGLLLHVEDG
jgi:lipopolysaccharide export system permease protein